MIGNVSLQRIEDVVAWGYRARDEAVPDAVIDAIRYRHPLGDALKAGRLHGEVLALLAFVGFLDRDRNAAFRAQVLATLMLGEPPTNAALLDALLDAEIARYATQPHSASIQIACYLNAHARPVVSTPKIWDAKLSSFDNQMMLDAQLCVVGGGVEATLTFLATSAAWSAPYEVLCEMRDKGELDALDVWRDLTVTRLREEARSILAEHETR